MNPTAETPGKKSGHSGHRPRQPAAETPPPAVEHAGHKGPEADTKTWARQQAAIAQLGQRALAGGDLSMLVDEAVSVVAQTLAVEYSHYLELLSAGDTLLLRAGVGWREGLVGQATVDATTDGQAGHILLSGEPVIFEDLAGETRLDRLQLLHDHQVESGVSVVVRGHDRPFGVLGAFSGQRRTFTEDELDFLQAVANILAMATDRKQAETQLLKRNRALVTLQLAGAAIASSLDLPYILNTVTKEMTGLLEVDFCVISEWDQAAGTISPLAGYGPDDWWDEKSLAKVFRLSDHPLAEKVLAQWSAEQMIIGHSDLDPAELAHLQRAGIKTLLMLPMVIQYRVVGLVEIMDRAERTFKDEEISLAQFLANQAASPIENARLYAETRKLLREQIALREAMGVISSTLDLETVLSYIAEQMARAIDATSAYISSYEPETQTSIVLAEYFSPDASPRERVSDLGATYYLPRDFPGTIESWQDGQPRIVQVDDPDLAEAERAHIQKFGAKTVLTIALRVGGRIIGNADLWESRRRREFTPQEIARCQDIAQQAAIAIENARLLAEMGKRAEQLAVLHELDRAIASSMHLTDIYHAFARHAIRLLPYDRMFITLLEGDEIQVSFVAGDEEDETPMPVGTVLPRLNSVIGWVIERGQPLLRHNVAADMRFVEDELLVASGVRSVIIIPLRVKGRVIGTWNIGSRQVGAYSPDDLEITQSIADQLAIAIDNARLYSAIRQHVNELATLNEISLVITSSLDLQETLTIITDHITKLLGVEAASLALYEETTDDLWFAASSGGSADFVRERRLAIDQGIMGWVVRHGEPVLIPDVSQDSRFFGRFDQESGFTTRSILCAPLQTKGQTIGAIEVINKTAGTFNQEDLRLLASLAATAATAIENARLYKQAQQEIAERKRAEEAQQKSLQELEIAYKQAMIYARELKEEVIERKRAEAALEEERALLARRVAERTAELSAANAELARAGRLKDEFLASMSHELRTPLTAILGLSEVLKSEVYGALTRRQLKSINSIEESGRHLLELINDILDLSKIGAGKLAFRLDPVSVEGICRASLQFTEQSARKKNLKVSFLSDGTVTTLPADERRLKQMLVNLLSNAVKFTPEGGEVGLEVIGDRASQMVHFTVWDTGIGIAPGDTARLFQPFVQLDSRLSRQFTGTGLGLVLVQKMAEMHGGRVSVESEVDRGSRFTISLPWPGPVEEPVKPTRPQPSQPVYGQMVARQTEHHAQTTPVNESDRAVTSGTASVSPRPPLILLAEDQDDLASLLADFLLSNGYRVVIAQNGVEALERTREEKPDVILMDIQMPEMDGLEATRRLRAESDGATIPIIALTALAMPGDRERCLAAGANEYLSKPVKLSQLAQVIQVQLKQRQ